MKLPAVAIAAALTCGIVLGLWPPIANHTVSHVFLLLSFAACTCLILAGLALVQLQRLTLSAVASMLSWLMLGLLGAGIAQQPLPPDHILMLADRGKIELHSPLRWYGALRDEPTKLPWGFSYEIKLSGVEYQGKLLTAGGGMRVSFAAHGDSQAPPDLHAGDEVTVLTQARRPQVFRDEGAFDRRAYLASQNIDLDATLRAPELIARVSRPQATPTTVLARVRRRLRDEIDKLFQAQPQIAGVLRAMLLGDRNFVDRDEATDFQKTGVFHVLVVAGLHVGAFAALLFWVGRKLQLAQVWTTLFTLALLAAYVAVVEQRPPVLRAALMAAAVVVGAIFYRRLDLLNSAAVAALVLLIARPLTIRDPSFQLTFVAIGCIAGLALPWLAVSVQPYAKALRGWRDVTRDVAHKPHAAQFRIDLRTTVRWISARMPRRAAAPAENALAGGLALTFRLSELLVLTVVLQVGMLPLMAADFHRITLAAPIANLFAVPLTGIVVPLGFLVLATGLLLPGLAKFLALPLGWISAALLHVVRWFADFPHWSYRIPGPPLWLAMTFLALLMLLAVVARMKRVLQRLAVMALCGGLLVCVGLVAVFPFRPRGSAGKLEVTILDVGQGDSLLVVSPKGRTLLIDGGGAFRGFPGREEHGGIDPGEEAVSPYLWSRGFQKLDVVALTHAHQDHLGGLTAILQNFHVGQLWIGREVASPALARLEDLARSRHIRIEHEAQGQTFAWDGVEGEFFWPASVGDAAASAKNNDSLVLRLRYGNRTILLPGDAEKAAERAILSHSSQADLQADVLKVGHHGSKNSTMPEFLASVRPRMAIISAGEENPYGHPSRDLLARLEDAGVRILRTDRDGAVHVLTDGDQVQVTCFVACPEPATNEALRHTQAPNQEQKSEQQ
jgi:competence protein ComEC